MGIFRRRLQDARGDNTQAIVQEADLLAPRLNLRFLEYAQARGFHIDAARVRSPKDKARVERSVQIVRDDCFVGERPGSLDEARDRSHVYALLGLCRRYGDARVEETCATALAARQIRVYALISPCTAGYARTATQDFIRGVVGSVWARRHRSSRRARGSSGDRPRA